MKCLKRNKRTFYYCLYKEEIDVLDGSGYETGDKRVVYYAPVELTANISPASGNNSVEQFGNLQKYDKVIVLDDISCPIDEHTVLFVDKAVEYDKSGNPLFDYVVTKVAKSINSVSIAITKVGVS